VIESEDMPDRPVGRPTVQANTRRELAWAADLVQSISGKEQFDAKGLVIAHGGLRSFFDDDESSKIIVSGARGMGKSVALAYKVSKLQAGSRYKMIPAVFPFMYGMAKKSIPLTGQQLYELGSAAKWRAIWLVSVGIFLAAWIRREERAVLDRSSFPGWAGELVDEANKWSGTRDEPFAAIVGVAVKLTSNRLENLYNEHISPILSGRSRRLAICVDAIDEAIAFSTSTGDVHSLFSRQSDVKIDFDGQAQYIKFSRLARDAWIAAQQGFAAAAARITSQTVYGIRVLGSLRLEARQHLPEQLEDVESKWESFIEDLKADRSDFAEIFSANVDRSDEDRFVNQEAADPVERLVGFKEIESRVVPHATETVLDHIVRHSFQTPRGLVQIGGAIYNKLPTGMSKTTGTLEQQTDRVIASINGCAADTVLKEHLSQLMPQLDERILQFALGSLEHNILSQIEMTRLNKKYAASQPTDTRPLLDQLFSAGLLGIPRKSENGWGQYFPDYEDSRENLAIPANAPFVLVHPALSAKRCQSNPEDYYRSTFLVGSGLKCPAVFYPAAITVKCIDKGIRKQLIALFEGNAAEPAVYNKSTRAVAYCFLLSLLFSLHTRQSSSVTAREIVEAAKDLAAAGMLEPSYGNPAVEPHRYLEKRFEELDTATAKADEQAIRDISQWFTTELDGQWRVCIEDEGHQVRDLCFSIQSKLTNRLISKSATQTFGDIDALDIDMRIRVSARHR
jgi:hypothetical protein